MSKQSVYNNTQLSFEFQGLEKRRVASDFVGGVYTYDKKIGDFRRLLEKLVTNAGQE